VGDAHDRIRDPGISGSGVAEPVRDGVAEFGTGLAQTLSRDGDDSLISLSGGIGQV